MTRHKLTPEIWDAMLTAYTEWDPTNPASPSIDDLCAGFDISKATFYYEMRKRNLPLKQDDRRRGQSSDRQVIEILVRIDEQSLRAIERLLRAS